MNIKKRTLAAITCFALLALSMASFARNDNKVTVFAAASTTNVMTEAGKLFENNKMGKVVYSFAAASTLAKQIEQGAPADIFISANTEWMDYLDERKMLETGSRFDLLGNSIVIIAPVNSTLDHIDVTAGGDLAKYLGNSRLSMGDPDHVPVGMYGMQALIKLGMWQGIEKQIARAVDVRSALTLVERGETPLGIVYSTDAKISDKVKVVGTFPQESHDPVAYPVAVVAGKKTEAVEQFIKILKSPEAKDIFIKYGFTVK